MTAQIDDTFHHRGTDFSLAGISEGELFEIELLGLRPVGMCTACWRGYQAVFAVSRSRLVLDTLHVNLTRQDGREENYEREPGPIINGVRPEPPDEEFDLFNNHYVGLDYHLEYTGGVLLADGFIDELYEHMGFHPAWKYQTVVELIFDAGILQHEYDRSERMAEVRQLVKKSHKKLSWGKTPTEQEIARYVEQAFDRSYRMDEP